MVFNILSCHYDPMLIRRVLRGYYFFFKSAKAKESAKAKCYLHSFNAPNCSWERAGRILMTWLVAGNLRVASSGPG